MGISTPEGWTVAHVAALNSALPDDVSDDVLKMTTNDGKTVARIIVFEENIHSEKLSRRAINILYEISPDWYYIEIRKLLDARKESIRRITEKINGENTTVLELAKYMIKHDYPELLVHTHSVLI
ncbi:MAG: hypothetical protein LBR22_02745 [Desulfovibrio sp.]|jgi:hypothetical protein|nr:hypothetical protein [Desulfovibrio sp.]